MNPDPESELIARARSGDEDAFAELVAAHADRVYAALRRFGPAQKRVSDLLRRRTRNPS